MIRVTIADGSERIFLQRSELAGVLGLSSDGESYRNAKRLLVEHGLLTPHRRKSSPAHGYLAPPEWESGHIPHLARIAKNLLADHGHPETPTLGRILQW